jgi:hypothetical protein
VLGTKPTDRDPEVKVDREHFQKNTRHQSCALDNEDTKIEQLYHHNRRDAVERGKNKIKMKYGELQ